MSTRLYIATAVVVALAAVCTVVALYRRDTPDGANPHRDERDVRRPAPQKPPSNRPELQPPTPNTQRPTTNTQPPTTNTQPPTPDTQHPTTNTQPPTPDTQHPTTTDNAWADPTNARVLGNSDWMAPVSAEEEARIDEVFEKARAARFDPRLSNEGRATSIEAAREVIDACFEQLQQRYPDAQGRLIVAWQSGAAGGQGWIRQPRISVNYRLDDVEFEACIVDGLDGRTFGAEDGDPIDVEAPFFFDGSF